MKLKANIIFFIGGLSLLSINHFLIDWQKLTYETVIEELDNLFELQERDLVQWQKDPNTISTFRKRFYCNNELIKWSDHYSFPEISHKEKVKLVSDKTGVYLTMVLNEGDCKIVSAFPLILNYKISNQYLNNSKNSILHPGLFAINYLKGDYNYKGWFYFSLNSPPNRIVDAVAAILILIALSSFFYFLALRAKSWLQFLSLVFILVFLRTFLLNYDVLPQLIRYQLFDSLYYYSSIVNPSLGDLLVNCFILLLIVISIIKKDIKVKSSLHSFLSSMLCSLLLLQVYYVEVSIINNSQISLDIAESIQFNFLRVVSFVCILLVSLASVLVINKVFRFSNKSTMKSTLFGFLLLPVVFCLIDFLPALLGLLLLVWFLIYSSLNLSRYHQYYPVSIIGISIVIALSSSLTIYKLYERNVIDTKKKFANYILLKRDIPGEYFLNEVINEIALDKTEYIGNSQEYYDFVLSKFTGSYFKKYEISLIDFEGTQEFELLGTEYSNVYFIDDKNLSGYLCDLAGSDYSVMLRYKSRVPSDVYPELLTDEKLNNQSVAYDYAVYKEDEILYQRSRFGSGEWLDADDLQNKSLFTYGIEKNGRHYFGLKTSDNQTILISSRMYANNKLFTNFFFFTLLLSLLFSIYYFSNSLGQIKKTFGFTSKLQFYFALSFIIPLTIIGIALLQTLNQSYKDEIDRNYLKRVLNLSETLSEESLIPLSFDLSRLSSLLQTDVSLYNTEGLLIKSSQPDIFKLGLQSNLINPIVFTELVDKGNQSVITDETIGRLSFKVCYSVIIDSYGQLKGFIAMPFFNSRNHLQRQQIDVFDSIVNVFGLILILSIGFGNMLLNNLFYPLRMVASKMRQITLDQENQPIVYDKQDEIGSLVKDYNRMLIQLENSKKELERSQKEMAWKGIAKQVAHEIKNPLTPMRLKIQQLMRRFEQTDKSYDTLKVLLAQVETLNDIATSFSAFADMPVPENQRINLSELVIDAAKFHQSELIDINLNVEDEIFVFTDKEMFGRILNNLILNAIQAVELKDPIINIVLAKQRNKVLLSIEDNGSGISEEIKHKVFINYFSTKSSGSGIGLALAKKGIENAGGNIWFESIESKGTTFYISMPIINT